MKPRKTQPTSRFATGLLVGLAAGSFWLAGPVLTAAGADLFTVDTAQSYVSISGSVLGNALHEQGPGSLTTHYEGALLADLSADAIQFPGQSQVMARDSGSWQPMSDGSDGSEPANYGGAASYFLTKGVAALRQVQLDVTSGPLAIADGQFDTQELTFSIPADAPSSLAYRVHGSFNSSGVVPIGGNSATGQMTLASLTTLGNQQVLTIPINYTIYFSLVNHNDTTITLSGQLVAIRNLAGSPVTVPTQFDTFQ